MKELRSIILAAGKGTRMKSDLAKVLHPVCGRPMLDYVMTAVKTSGSLKNYVVLGHQIERVKEILPSGFEAVEQRQLKGTADAVRCVESKFQAVDGDVLVLCGDTPLLQTATLKRLIKHHRMSGSSATVLSAVVQDSTGYGRVIRGINGAPVAIREEKDASEAEKNLLEINTGVYCFKAGALFRALSRIRENALKKEFYLTDVIEILADQGLKTSVIEVNDPREAQGVNSRVDLAVAESVMRRRILETFMLKGISIQDPATTYIDADVKIGTDTVIRPFCVIERDVRIGRGCVIGPFARLRSGSRIGDQTEIGNFTEVSRTQVGSGCFMKHFSFLGDAKLGDNVNIGAGVVTANYDGQNKHQTRIKDQAFIGSDSILVAPVDVGKGAVTGAGCVVAKEKKIPDGAVMVGVPGRIIGKKKTEKPNTHKTRRT